MSKALNHMTVAQMSFVQLLDTAAALGVQETAQVENSIKSLKSQAVPLILVSHSLRQVFDLVDRNIVFRRGHLVANLISNETDGNHIVSYITSATSQNQAAANI